MLIDAWLATRIDPKSLDEGATLVTWLSNGAITTLLVLILSVLAAREVAGFVRYHRSLQCHDG